MTTLQTYGRFPYEFRKYLEWPNCPRCGETLVAPDSSVLVAHGDIRHGWSCDDCGYAFETAVRLATGEACAG